MKKILSLTLASVMLLSSASCGKVAPAELTVTSSAAEFLAERLGNVPENVVLGDATVAESYGVDMSNFEDDGYILRTVGDETLVFGKTEDGLDRAVRKYAKAVQNDTADTLNETYHEGYRIERLTLADRDISEYTVYYPETANENMKFAADELVRLVKKATGVELPIVVGKAVAPAIELRHTDDPALETDGYHYSVTEDGLVIEGAVERGCMNGVWRFLENECGWDFLIYGDSYLNESDHVDVPVDTAREEEPSFEHLYLANNYDHYKNDRVLPTSEQNSYGVIWHATHGIFNFYEGSSATKHPCYTDEDFYEETLENIDKQVAANYDNPGFKSVNIGQNDDANYCQCVSCLQVLAEEGSNVGAVIRHANYVSEEINAKYPGRNISFLIYAYAGSNAPPKKTMPNEWIYITFCYDWNCTNHKFDGSDCKDTVYFYDRSNTTYAEWIEEWCRITPNMYVYPYNLDKGLLDYTVINNIYDDYRYLRDIGVKGVCLEGSSFGDFAIKRLEQMLIAQVNWNYDMTRDEFTAMFHKLLEYEYGDGWKMVLEYIDGWEKSQDLAKCWSWWGTSGTDQDSRHFEPYFYMEQFDTFMELLDEAIYEANSALQEEMITRLTCLVLYKGCYSSYFFAYLAEDEEWMADLSAKYDRCMDTLRSFGYDPENLGIYSYAMRHHNLTIEEEAWSKWYKYFYVLTGQPLPEDAPVIETTEVED